MKMMETSCTHTIFTLVGEDKRYKFIEVIIYEDTLRCKWRAIFGDYRHLNLMNDWSIRLHNDAILCVSHFGCSHLVVFGYKHMSPTYFSTILFSELSMGLAY